MTSLPVIVPACTSYNDFVGSAAGDGFALEPQIHSLYELAGLARESWLVVALDIVSKDGSEAVIVHAVDLESRTDGQRTDIDALIAEFDHLPVTSFRVDCAPGEAVSVLLQAFAELDVQLVARGFRDQKLVTHREVRRVGPGAPAPERWSAA